MRFVLFALVAVVAASPFPAGPNAASSAASPAASASKTKHHNHHKEPTPTFNLPCNCKKPVIPNGQMNAKEVGPDIAEILNARTVTGTLADCWM